jgi:glycosyltransferase involved in cell wall biosynthesis
MRYAWDLQHQYLRESRLETGPGSVLARIVLHYMRQWDVQTANRVDHFIANSQFIRQRIHTIYRRKANVINPPVDVDRFALCEIKSDYYVAASRLVPYKMIGIIIDAFNRMPERELRVIGDGPQFEEFKRRAKPNVKLMGHQPFESLRRQLQGAKAYLCAALEDFGILPVEAQACGTPVIAYGKGGVRETVIPGRTGLFFNEQTAEAIVQAISDFERMQGAFVPRTIRLHAERYSAQRFRELIQDEIEACWVAKYGTGDGTDGMFSFPQDLENEALAV